MVTYSCYKISALYIGNSNPQAEWHPKSQNIWCVQALLANTCIHSYLLFTECSHHNDIIIIVCINSLLMWPNVIGYIDNQIASSRTTLVPWLSSPWLSENSIIQTVSSQIPQSKYL